MILYNTDSAIPLIVCPHWCISSVYLRPVYA